MILTLKTKKDKSALLHTTAGLLVNLSAGYYGVILIGSSINFLSGNINIGLLIVDAIIGTIFLWLSYEFERRVI